MSWLFANDRELYVPVIGTPKDAAFTVPSGLYGPLATPCQVCGVLNDKMYTNRLYLMAGEWFCDEHMPRIVLPVVRAPRGPVVYSKLES